ncbi:MAG: helix-turn-helix transcriptional regulator [Deltaproteobacteria bacterium]|nr:helix-turn-helix transcriptional regulator [Deltaproteobacteria bacterium]
MTPRPAIQARRLPRRRGRPPIPRLRETILQAAEAIFTRRQYHEVQMDEVAAACGVGKGTLYRHFRSKRELYLAIMFDGIARLRAELETALAAGDAPARQVERIVRGTLAFFWDRRFFFALIHGHESKSDGDAREWLRQRAQLSSLVQEALEQATAAGHVRAIDCRIAAEMLLGMMRGVNRYRTREDGLERLVATVVDVFMRGVGTRAGRRVLAGRPRLGGRGRLAAG